MKNLIGIIITLVMTFISITILMSYLNERNDKFLLKVNKSLSKIERVDSILLTSRVIILKDTLDIIRTDWMSSEVTLSNNISYDYKYIQYKFLKNTKYKIDKIIKE